MRRLAAYIRERRLNRGIISILDEGALYINDKKRGSNMYFSIRINMFEHSSYRLCEFIQYSDPHCRSGCVFDYNAGGAYLRHFHGPNSTYYFSDNSITVPSGARYVL